MPNPQPEKSSNAEVVIVSDWVACLKSTDNTLVLSCIITAADAGVGITGAGLILNTEEGAILASFYTGLSPASESFSPAFNLPSGEMLLGDSVWAVAQGECGGQHFFFEQELTIGNC